MTRPRHVDPLGVVCGAALLVFTTVLVAVAQAWGPLEAFDRSSVTRLHQVALSHHGWTWLMRGISDAARRSAFLPPLVAIGTAVVRANRRRLMQALIVLLALITSSRVNDLVKILVGRTRPTLPTPVDVAPGFSFPSGHAQSAVVTLTLLSWLALRVSPPAARRPLVGLAAFGMLAIGFSRVALGVHYPSDVLGGYALGVVWSSIALWLLRRAEADARSIGRVGTEG